MSENWCPFVRSEKELPLSENTETPRAEDPEAELLAACQRGEAPAFERLYQTHGARMKSLAANLLGDRSDAEDAVQETFLKIYRGASSFRGAAKLSTWTYRVLVNTCLDFRRRRVRTGQTDVPMESGGANRDLSVPAADHPLRIDLEASLGHLKEKHRTAFLLFEVEGLTHREVGEILGVPEGTSRALLFEAKRDLARLLRRRRTGKEVQP